MHTRRIHNALPLTRDHHMLYQQVVMVTDTAMPTRSPCNMAFPNTSKLTSIRYQSSVDLQLTSIWAFCKQCRLPQWTVDSEQISWTSQASINMVVQVYCRERQEHTQLSGNSLYIDDLEQDYNTSIANAMEMAQCIEPSVLVKTYPGPWFNIKMTSYQCRNPIVETRRS